MVFGKRSAKGHVGIDTLHDPLCNKGSAFTAEERTKLKISGLIPTAVEDMEAQIGRVKSQFDASPTPLAKYSFLAMLQENNVRLFYHFLNTHLLECLPIVYTPTVGEACVEYSHIFRRPQGMYLSSKDKGNFRKILNNWPGEPQIIVVTDGGRILGLGDLGLNGMGIPIGKLSLYVAGAGFDPSKTLPIMLDMGTNNKKLLEDPMYLGSKHERLPEDEYYAILDEFIMAINTKWPNCMLQFEDFSTPHAIKLLADYREKVLCFNDDIQGTGSVILSGFINALKSQGTDAKEVKCVFFGAGSAAIGTALMICAWLETQGLSEEEARRRFWLLDSKGLLTDTRGDADTMAEHKRPFSRPDEPLEDLLSVIKSVQPHVLMGLAGQGPAFTKEMIGAMQEHTPKPIVFPLSNPTSKAELSAENAYNWTNGKCIFAAGSPFAPVEVAGKTYYPAQGNNMLVFPGVGLGAVLAKSKKVTDLMFINAAKAIADMVTKEELEQGKIYPDLTRLQEISAMVAVRTMETAYEQKIAKNKKPKDLAKYCKANMWMPSY